MNYKDIIDSALEDMYRLMGVPPHLRKTRPNFSIESCPDCGLVNKEKFTLTIHEHKHIKYYDCKHCNTEYTVTE